MIKNMQQPKWSAEEERIVMDHYPAGGWRAVQAILPGRSKQAIYKAASKVGARDKNATNQTCSEPEGWPVPSPADLSDQLLHLHHKRAYGAVPGQLTWRV